MMANGRKRQIGALVQPVSYVEGKDDVVAERDATLAEEREATDEPHGPVHGHRGDLGDSEPGED